MGGVHVIQRSTQPSTSFVIKGISTLVLPSTLTYRPNTTNYQNGAFPEFIHGFFKGNYGFDAGIMYKDGNFSLFFYCGSLTSTKTWDEHAMPNIKMGDTVEFTTQIYQTGVMLTCKRANSSLSYTMSATLKPDAYDAMKNGCLFRREMVIAINPNSSGAILVPTGASFTTATFSNTDLYMANGTTAQLKSSNSTVVEGTFDSDTPTHTYNGDGSSSTSNGYVNDYGYGYI